MRLTIIYSQNARNAINLELRFEAIKQSVGEFSSCVPSFPSKTETIKIETRDQSDEDRDKYPYDITIILEADYSKPREDSMEYIRSQLKESIDVLRRHGMGCLGGLKVNIAIKLSK
jgi:hypothetical protein